jgi:glycosyltransferase involved in cell wall biosynthesis
VNDSSPVVSIIMPAYNTPAAFVREAIASVRSQTHPHWELLVVDDGSTDASCGSAIEACVAEDPSRIRMLCHPGRANRGASASRQLAIEAARGDLFAFLDADDLWLPDKLSEQIALLDACPEADVVYGATRYWSSWSTDPDRPEDHTPGLGVATERLYAAPELLRGFVRGTATIPCTCSLIVRRRALERSGGFEPARTIYDDQMFYAKLFLRSPAWVSRSCWDWYRQHEDSWCHEVGRRGDLVRVRREYLDWLEAFLETEGVADAELRDAVRQAQWLIQLPEWLPDSLQPRVRWLRKWVKRLGGGA